MYFLTNVSMVRSCCVQVWSVYLLPNSTGTVLGPAMLTRYSQPHLLSHMQGQSVMQPVSRVAHRGTLHWVRKEVREGLGRTGIWERGRGKGKPSELMDLTGLSLLLDSFCFFVATSSSSSTVFTFTLFTLSTFNLSVRNSAIFSSTPPIICPLNMIPRSHNLITSLISMSSVASSLINMSSVSSPASTCCSSQSWAT